MTTTVFFVALAGRLFPKSGGAPKSVVALLNPSERNERVASDIGASGHLAAHLKRGTDKADACVVVVTSPKGISRNPYTFDAAAFTSLSSKRIGLVASLLAAGATIEPAKGHKLPKAFREALTAAKKEAAKAVKASAPKVEKVPTASRKKAPKVEAVDAQVAIDKADNAPTDAEAEMVTDAPTLEALIASGTPRREALKVMEGLEALKA